MEKRSTFGNKSTAHATIDHAHAPHRYVEQDHAHEAHIYKNEHPSTDE